MNIYPKNLAEQVDFNHILQRVHDYCYCSKAKQMAIELSPSASFARIRLQLTETNEFLLAIHKGDLVDAADDSYSQGCDHHK